MANKEIIFTFSYNNWALATTIELLANKLGTGGEYVWIDWTGKFVRKHEYFIATKLVINQTKRRMRRSNLIAELTKLGPHAILRYENLTPKTVKFKKNINEIAEQVSYLQLISVVRESKPIKNDYRKLLKEYKKTYINTYMAAITLLRLEKPSKVFLFNGRFLQERAVWEACKDLNLDINFFEKFSPDWFDRYHIFESSTHSPKYRSDLMEAFYIDLMSKGANNFNELGYKWFNERIQGISQNFTSLQIQNLGLEYLKPYYVFFHSSEDELITTDLISKNWGDQISALRSLISVMNSRKKYNLIIRLHPNLLHKSPREIKIWQNLVESISKEYSWVTVVKPESPINSYRLVEESLGVVTVGSTIGVEAAFMGKKSILLGTAFHEYMGITINPKTELELDIALDKVLTNPEKTLAKDSALKYALFHYLGGNKMNYVISIAGKRETRYKFQNFHIKHSKISLIITKIIKNIYIKKINIFLGGPRKIVFNFTKK